MSPLFSVIIPTCDRPQLLRLCLDALAPGVQTLGEPFETIVTDDGLQPTDELLRSHYPWVQWTRGPRRGPAANRNHGAAQAQGQWLAFTDDDCVPHPGWLEHYALAIAAHAKARAFEGSIHPRGDLDRDLAECPVNLNGDCFWSANICVERALFTAVEGFDQRFRIAAHEDQDLFLRLKKRTEIPFVREAAVSHPVRYGTLWASLRGMKTSTINWVYFAKAHTDELRYRNDVGIVAAGYWSQVMAAYQALKRGYPRQFCRALAMLSYGMPFVAYRLLIRKDIGNAE